VCIMWGSGEQNKEQSEQLFLAEVLTCLSSDTQEHRGSNQTTMLPGSSPCRYELTDHISLDQSLCTPKLQDKKHVTNNGKARVEPWNNWVLESCVQLYHYQSAILLAIGDIPSPGTGFTRRAI